MKKIIILVCLFVFCTAVSAQLHMREVFAQLPDSVLPLMSKNNRLDCIDFIEKSFRNFPFLTYFNQDMWNSSIIT